MDKIYELKLHESTCAEGWDITRVPGGWIYRTNREASEVFIPLNNEFQKEIKPTPMPSGGVKSRRPFYE